MLSGLQYSKCQFPRGHCGAIEIKFGCSCTRGRRKYLTQQTCEQLVHASVTSRLDYCNSLLYGLPAK